MSDTDTFYVIAPDAIPVLVEESGWKVLEARTDSNAFG
jgi:hypothetical protein